MYAYYVYILQNEKGRLYKGHTDNLSDRINRHNQGRVLSTKNKGPWKLIYKESFESRGEAMKREKQLKKWNRSKLLQLIQESIYKEV